MKWYLEHTAKAKNGVSLFVNEIFWPLMVGERGGGGARFGSDLICFICFDYIYLSIYICIYLSIHLPTYLSIYLYIYSFIYLFIYLFICLESVHSQPRPPREQHQENICIKNNLKKKKNRKKIFPQNFLGWYLFDIEYQIIFCWNCLESAKMFLELLNWIKCCWGGLDFSKIQIPTGLLQGGRN